VVVLLTRWFSNAPTPTLGAMLLIALLAGALPLALMLAIGARGLAQNVRPTAAVVVGMRRMALPALACLLGVYLLLLQHTLMLDTLATHAINEAEKNDRQWVLTHTGDE
jgi:threonine/homoserine/homoserine lactone efflux protein